MENLNPNTNPNGKNSQQSDLQLTQKQVPKLCSQNVQQIPEISQNLEKNNNNETQKQIHFPIENPSLKKLEKNNSSNSQNSANKRNFEQFQNQSENVLNESQNQDTEILEEQEAQSDQHSVSKHSSSYEEQPGTPIVDNNQSYSQNTNNLNVNNNSSLQNDSLQNSQDEIGNSDKENLIEQPIDNINIQKLITDQKKSQNLELNFPVPLIFRNQEPVFHKFNLGWQFANFQRQKEQLINQIDFHTEVFLEKNCTIEQLLIAYYKVKHHKFCNQFENFYNVQVSNFQNEYIIVDILFQYPDFEIQEEIQGNSEQQAGNQMEIEENQSEETEEDLDQEDTQDSNTEQ
ncbi:hypothetical protein PPERSA_10409 [Pseudocohnilembus persalinus]|uniref:Uncharacterized protein n=1 Tax=Pseudocohnilembus persalinus TaxID=266149 RepID=A0A0V0QWC0_PSEPJ|nr:hypothetical protein PPERSA_10409 [Pseudocohnilembus persalinus]|eukprot:KRX06551.1 hypothetical protein PPERSA_10409 [Pseudocohnilembus persalinus]